MSGLAPHMNIPSQLRDSNPEPADLVSPATRQQATNGRGIPRTQLGEMFTPGFTTKGRGVGSGLGWANSRKSVRKHHGNLRVDRQMGLGPTATVRLPLRLAIEDGPLRRPGIPVTSGANVSTQRSGMNA
jgi:Histidine kinase-, DNA gyrase B-, and HSP90-like ATPase